MIENDLIPQMMWFQDLLRWLFGKEGKSVDKMGEGEDGDPGYESIMDTTGISWWNVNPIYVPLASEVVIGVDEFKSLVTQNAMSSLSQGRGCFRYWNNACVPTNLALKYIMPVWCAGQPGQTRDSLKRGRTENLAKIHFSGEGHNMQIAADIGDSWLQLIGESLWQGVNLWICHHQEFRHRKHQKSLSGRWHHESFQQKRGEVHCAGWGHIIQEAPSSFERRLPWGCSYVSRGGCKNTIEAMLVVLQLYRHTFQNIATEGLKPKPQSSFALIFDIFVFTSVSWL